MRKLIPHLWYDKEALEAASLYVSLFEDSKLVDTRMLFDTPSGDTQIVDFQLAGIDFSAISAGPYFSLNPSVSLMVACGSPEEVDRLYSALSAGGSILMPLGEYPFSGRYVWLQDRYGLSWQLMLADNAGKGRRIRPVLLFAGDSCGKAEEALGCYLSAFDGSSKGHVSHYQAGEAGDARARINYSELNVPGLQLIAMDHGLGGDFTFNEAFSFVIPCADQEEIDYFWDKLSAVAEAEQCGWVKDRFGLSWQIVPERLDAILASCNEEEARRVTAAFLRMKKLDIAAIERARSGENEAAAP